MNAIAKQEVYSTKRVTVWSHQDKDGKPGVAVQYEDGYVSWCPQQAFERDYQTLSKLSFGHAIDAMRRGQKVTRAGWNGDGMWIALTTTAWSGGLAANAILMPSDWRGCAPFFVLFAADKLITPWQPTTADALANDWQVIA